MYSYKDMDRTEMGIYNYINCLTSSATAMGILFAVLSSSVSKGKGTEYEGKSGQICIAQKNQFRFLISE
jgi:hypothetical protein